MKIAILGTRGVPPRYGGFETFAAELGTRLVARGHSVLVYCREGGDARWNGIERVELPAIRQKYFETVSHAFVSALDAIRRPLDVVLVCNAANAFVLPLFRSMRIPCVINVDGIERKRRKWNALGRLAYLAGEAMSATFADRVIADADVISAYYRRHLNADPIVIPYGSDFPEEADSAVLERLQLRSRQYLLYVSRFEPENNPHEVAEAYGRARTEVPLVMVGDAPYAGELIRELKSAAGPRILFPGGVYGADYRTLQRNALFYIQATEVGGTHPALIEAMRSGGAVLALDTPENREVGGEAVRYFRLGGDETLSVLIALSLEDRSRLDHWRAAARARAVERYSWDAVTTAYEKLFETVV